MPVKLCAMAQHTLGLIDKDPKTHTHTHKYVYTNNVYTLWNKILRLGKDTECKLVVSRASKYKRLNDETGGD